MILDPSGSAGFSLSLAPKCSWSHASSKLLPDAWKSSWQHSKINDVAGRLKSDGCSGHYSMPRPSVATTTNSFNFFAAFRLS